MVFSSSIFLFLFLPLVLIGYYNPIFKGRAFRNVFLLLASLAFYAWGEPVFLFVMMFSILFNWFLGLKIDKSEKQKKRKALMILAIVFNLGLLFVFKYLTFVCENINLFAKTDFFTVKIALPIGISFYTFQIITYIVDIYRRNVSAQKSLINTGLYISIFPPLIAGPIVRYESVADQINSRKENSADFTAGMSRFIVGLGKKVLIANYVGFVVDNIFSSGRILSTTTAWLGAICYTLQIYFDFSGYSDMAIGLGRMFGFRFLENFNYPYIAKSITDFWRRWHISLSSFFRDYLYIPLGGSRVSKKRLLLNLFIVWTLTGIWHGANWTFMAWGIFYFILLALEKFTRFNEKFGIFGHVYTMFFVIIGWILFRCDNFTQVGIYFAAMFRLSGSSFTDGVFTHYFNSCKLVLIAGILFAFPVIPFLKKKLQNFNAKLYDIASSSILFVLFVISIAVCIRSTYNPFIYFNF